MKHHWFRNMGIIGISLLLVLTLCAGCAVGDGPVSTTGPTEAPAQEKEILPDVIRSVYEPETALIAPPTVIERIDTDEKLLALQEAAPTQAAWFTVSDDEKNTVQVGPNRYTLADVFEACYGRVIPVFELTSVEAAANLQALSKTGRTTDFLVAASDPAILAEISLTGVRKGLITDKKYAECAQAVHAAGADIAVVSDCSREEAEYLQLRFISVMLRPDGQTDAAVRSALDCGANQVVVDEHAAAYALYASVKNEPEFVRRPFIVAHQGLPGYAPGNSVESFIEAVNAGADVVECDVYVTADEQLLISHDEDLRGTTQKGDTLVESLTREELKAYTLEVVGEYTEAKFAFLDEFFDLMQGNDVLLIIEIKTENPNCIRLIRQLAVEKGMLDRINIISFSEEQIKSARELMCEVGASLVVNVGTNPADKLLRSFYQQTGGFDGAYSPNDNFTGEGVRAFQHRGILVNLWTVDGEKDMLSAAQTGITFLTTNTTMYRQIIDQNTENMRSSALLP